MTIHKEGWPSIALGVAVCTALCLVAHYALSDIPFLYWIVVAIGVAFLFIILQFFRLPSRSVNINDSFVLSPCDGKVVVIEEVMEPEYFKDKRIQLSVFMSPINVHANWYPWSGIVKYFKYHPGKYLVAWHPKSSTENERSTIVIQRKDGTQILVRQIAGALARRIVTYSKEGQTASQGDEIGFIKFGSRVDVFLPLNTKIKVAIGDKVTGKISILAEC